ncbi:MAG TPA: ABC transporter permease [Candidatus Saccharimonadales bacterium]|nr:ABC transporter permease [Candidatus Saccharimonadales bacterium]
MMHHAKITLATARRVLQQLLHDPRTLALLFIVPCVLLGLLAWIYSNAPTIYNQIGAPLLGIFPFVVMFLITSITMLRERSSGTLERLLTMPVARGDILFGYAITFGSLAVVQALVASTLALKVYGLTVLGPDWFLVVVALADALLGTTLGLFVSAFARTEFQAIQFFPAFILPQFLLCGLLMPLAQLPRILHDIAQCLPLTYAVDAMQRVTTHTQLTNELYRDVAVVLAFALAAVILGATTLRRQTK